MGSGTTAIAAKLMNRRYKGFEISEEYSRNCRSYMELLSDKIKNQDIWITNFMNETRIIR